MKAKSVGESPCCQHHTPSALRATPPILGGEPQAVLPYESRETTPPLNIEGVDAELVRQTGAYDTNYNQQGRMRVCRKTKSSLGGD